MKLSLILALALTSCTLAVADIQEEWKAASTEFREVNQKFAAKERELRGADAGSPELEAKALEAFLAFSKAIDEHPDLKSYGEKLKVLERDLGETIREKDDQNRESAMLAISKLKGEQMNAALKIPEIAAKKNAMEAAQLKAYEALVSSDPEAKALLKRRQELFAQMNELGAKAKAE